MMLRSASEVRARSRRQVAAASVAVLLASAALSGPANAAPAPRAHDVYTESNAAAAAGGNTVVAFLAGPHGTLRPAGTFATGGAGTGASLGSQGALATDGRYLLAVNGGSNSVSAFAIGRDGALQLLGAARSGGMTPISVTLHGGLAYVLNAGSNTIAGFRLGPEGLQPIPGDIRDLSAGAAGAAEIAFAPGGGHLLVTEKGSSTLDTFDVMPDGMAGPARSTPSDGSVPYGFAFSRAGVAVVSDAASSALSTYILRGPGPVRSVARVPDGELAACWVAVSDHGFAYTSDAHSGNISSYRVGPDGQLTLVDAVAATTGGAPLDLALSPGQHTLFVLNAGSQTIQAMAVWGSGGLGSSAPVAAVPATASGLATVAR